MQVLLYLKSKKIDSQNFERTSCHTFKSSLNNLKALTKIVNTNRPQFHIKASKITEKIYTVMCNFASNTSFGLPNDFSFKMKLLSFIVI